MLNADKTAADAAGRGDRASLLRPGLPCNLPASAEKPQFMQQQLQTAKEICHFIRLCWRFRCPSSLADRSLSGKSVSHRILVLVALTRIDQHKADMLVTFQSAKPTPDSDILVVFLLVHVFGVWVGLTIKSGRFRLETLLNHRIAAVMKWTSLQPR